MTGRYLQAVFDAPIGADVCRQLKALGFDGLRADVQRVRGSAAPDAILQEAQAAGLGLLLIVRDAEQMLQLHARGTTTAPIAYELRNEPDLEGPPAAEYRSLMHDAADTGLPLYVGAVSNLNARGLDYLRALRLDELPDRVAVSHHWYPHGERPEVAHPGFGSRSDEVLAFRQIIGARRFACTEFGYHTGPRTTGWWIFRRTRRWTDADVAVFVRWEWSFWSRWGADFAVLYQLNDGSTSDPIDRFGIRYQAGAWKPVVSSLT